MKIILSLFLFFLFIPKIYASNILVIVPDSISSGTSQIVSGIKIKKPPYKIYSFYLDEKFNFKKDFLLSKYISLQKYLSILDFQYIIIPENIYKNIENVNPSLLKNQNLIIYNISYIIFQKKKIANKYNYKYYINKIVYDLKEKHIFYKNIYELENNRSYYFINKILNSSYDKYYGAEPDIDILKSNSLLFFLEKVSKIRKGLIIILFNNVKGLRNENVEDTYAKSGLLKEGKDNYIVDLKNTMYWRIGEQIAEYIKNNP